MSLDRAKTSITGVYYDKDQQRQAESISIGGQRLSLSEGQRTVLDSLLTFVRRAPVSSVLPAYISAETGSGKTEVALRLAVLIMREMSLQLRQLHGAYLSPTRKLAEEAAGRLNAMVQKEMPDVRMVSISGQDEEKVERVRQAFSVFESEHKTLLATNIQFLASLATKTAAFYKIPSRTGQFQLVASLSETNIIIVDEPHFYSGKAFVRVLALLLAILEHKRSSGGTNPTLLLFISATMNVPEIERLFRYLMADCGLELAPLVDEASWPLEKRRLEIIEADHGEKWSVFETADSIAALFARIATITQQSQHFTVVYWDSVPMLVRLQQFLASQTYNAIVWHSQMPSRLQLANLQQLRNGKVRIALTTSAAEVGIEFERWGVTTVDRMVSVNTFSVAKAIQRWGRLARRSNATGVVHFIDLPGLPDSVTEKMVNGAKTFDLTKKDYPNLLSRKQEFQSEFSTAYRSLMADRAFAHSIKSAIASVTGQVLPIYLSTSIPVRDWSGEEQLFIPLGKLSAGAMVVQDNAWLEFGNRNGDFFFTLRNGQLAWKPTTLMLSKMNCLQHRSAIRSRALPDWAKQLGLFYAGLWDGEVSIALPNLDAGFRFKSELLALHFPLGTLEVGPAFRTSELCECLLESFRPASSDLDALASRRSEDNADIVYLYEPARRDQDLAVGAVEYAWREILGGDYPCSTS